MHGPWQLSCMVLPMRRLTSHMQRLQTRAKSAVSNSIIVMHGLYLVCLACSIACTDVTSHAKFGAWLRGSVTKHVQLCKHQVRLCADTLMLKLQLTKDATNMTGCHCTAPSRHVNMQQLSNVTRTTPLSGVKLRSACSSVLTDSNFYHATMMSCPTKFHVLMHLHGIIQRTCPLFQHSIHFHCST